MNTHLPDEAELEAHTRGFDGPGDPSPTSRSGVCVEDLDAVPANARPGAPARSPGPGGEARRTRALPLTFKAYGRKAALEFREHIATQGYPTVMLEAAAAVGERRYDWQRKISVQMMPRELPAVACVLTGALNQCEFRNHGPEKNKGFSIERQEGQYFVKVFRSGDERAMHAVPVTAEDAFFISALVLRQLARSVPDTDAALISAALRGYAALARG